MSETFEVGDKVCPKRMVSTVVFVNGNAIDYTYEGTGGLRFTERADKMQLVARADGDAPTPDFADVRARLAKITPGEWRISQYYWTRVAVGLGQIIADCDADNAKEDADFIARAPADLRRLLDAYDAQQARIDALEAALEPFGELWDMWHDSDDYDGETMGAFTDWLYYVSVIKVEDDVRNAYAVLHSAEDGGEG